MQFRDLKAQYAALKQDIDQAVQQVLDDCNFISGKQVESLENSLAEFTGTKHCIACGNGTDAIAMTLMAWNVQKGDAVFVPDFTFFASGEVVSFVGATPVFYDVEYDTFNASASSLEDAIKAVMKEGKLCPKVIIGVDLFGQPADYIKLQEIADKYSLLLLEDGAQGFGGSIGNRRACSFGNAATTSFFPAKPLGCYGDGGAVFTDDDTIADELRSLRVHGKGQNKYDNIRIGWNSRLDTIQAAVLEVKLKAFQNYELDAVNRVAELYTKRLQGTVEVPVVPETFYSSWAQYTIKLEAKEQRDMLQEHLKSKGIPSMIYYPKGMQQQTAFSEVRQYVSCNTSERLCNTVLSLPMHPYLAEQEIEYIAEEVIYAK
ncbi:DegT/DnrJ/EryC1/StrS family aminotransferase [Clostridium sp. AF15-17LB]|nr:DegT/DnrJ/EryC1/StrS family aminotransferase [Clostridium sp. AF15-17LB]